LLRSALPSPQLAASIFTPTSWQAPSTEPSHRGWQAG
jgi:hypothetical protein